MYEDGISRDGLRTGDHVVITGGGGGFGRAFSRRLASMGAKVSVLELKDDSGNETVRLIREAGGEATFVKVDLADQHSIEKAIKAVPGVGGVSVNLATGKAGVGIVPVVGVDGWARIINNHPQFDGMEFVQDDENLLCPLHGE